ncbi:hypothetical protein ILUMI_22158 [Ignelater luminosus]|uniref:Serpin domain-containing protein n=1 Tax=Ignelater luminosus TaxID=2038154 RepID=A0A8K0FXJ1_IGNLU|nr:hypothetical protein ILUMI_22158 [Ignelater luminosus]
MSPFLLHTSLGFMYYCGKDATAEQISNVLFLPNRRNKIPEVFMNRLNSLVGSTEHILKNVSMLCLKHDCKIKDIYRKIASECFGVDICNIDFEDKKGSAKEINNWIVVKTQKTIKDVIDETDITQHIRAILINAMYFQGQWRLEFPFGNTEKKYFFLENSEKILTLMMEVTDYFNYSENESLQAQFLEIPYEGNLINMTLVLPIVKNGLSALEDHLEAALCQSHCYQPVHVIIPKFKVQTTVEFIPMLRKMGISDAFKNKADFSQVGNDGKRLPINSVIQKTQLLVEENGTIMKPPSTAAFSKHEESSHILMPDGKLIAFLYFESLNQVTIIAVAKQNAEMEDS